MFANEWIEKAEICPPRWKECTYEYMQMLAWEIHSLLRTGVMPHCILFLPSCTSPCAGWSKQGIFKHQRTSDMRRSEVTYCAINSLKYMLLYMLLARRHARARVTIWLHSHIASCNRFFSSNINNPSNSGKIAGSISWLEYYLHLLLHTYCSVLAVLVYTYTGVLINWILSVSLNQIEHCLGRRRSWCGKCKVPRQVVALCNRYSSCLQAARHLSWPACILYSRLICTIKLFCFLLHIAICYGPGNCQRRQTDEIGF